jgi:hypothetical protein
MHVQLKVQAREWITGAAMALAARKNCAKLATKAGRQVLEG